MIIMLDISGSNAGWS